MLEVLQLQDKATQEQQVLVLRAGVVVAQERRVLLAREAREALVELEFHLQYQAHLRSMQVAVVAAVHLLVLAVMVAGQPQ